MDAETSSRAFAELFPQVFRRFHRRDAVDAPRISVESVAFLQHLMDTGPLTIAEACRHFERSQSAMSELVNRLERRAYIRRFPDERDRRRTLVWVAKAGRVALQRATHVLSEPLLHRAFLTLRDEDRARLIDGMRALLATPIDTTPGHDEVHDDDDAL